MPLREHAAEFAGKPVLDWEPGEALRDPIAYLFRLRLNWKDEGTWNDKFSQFLQDPASQAVTGIVVGFWGSRFDRGDSTPIIEALVAAHERLPNLTALFLGDILSEEDEISWIRQSDVSPLLSAYPNLEYFTVRGGNGLSFGSLRHDRLKALVVQSGGLSAETVREIAAARLPDLEHLEIWLGEDSYGGDATVSDLAALLTGTGFPKLTYLGLRDSEIADEIAIAVADSPILKRLQVLDLSLGTLTDEGARALLVSQAIRGLKKLDIHHHYCSLEMVEQLTGVRGDEDTHQLLLPGVNGALHQSSGLGIEVDASEREEPDEDDDESYRYVAVGE